MIRTGPQIPAGGGEKQELLKKKVAKQKKNSYHKERV
jgi:hypothetical protein